MKDFTHPEFTVQCPVCKARINWLHNNSYRPFCSERCNNLDFVARANEQHLLAGDATYETCCQRATITIPTRTPKAA